MRVSYIQNTKLDSSYVNYRSNKTSCGSEQDTFLSSLNKEKGDINANDVANVIGFIGTCTWLLGSSLFTLEKSNNTIKKALTKVGEIGVYIWASVAACSWLAKEIRNDAGNKCLKHTEEVK